MRLILSALLVLALVPGWTGVDRLPLIGDDVVAHGYRWAPEGGWPRRIGALEPVGAVALSASDPAFGGFSALSLAGGRATLLSDGGNVVAVAIRGNQLATLGATPLPAGPGTGWAKESRDTESLAHDPASGRWWIGYERANAVWRYTPSFGRAEGVTTPRAMRRWSDNGGPESLVRLADGRFLTIAEGRVAKRRLRPALLFDGDPTARGTRAARLGYLPPPGTSPSDAAELPNGDLVVLNRRFRLPFRFFCDVVVVPRRTLRAGAVMRGRTVAHLGPDDLFENCEGVAVTRERGATMLWIVTDNDLSPFRPSILAKFRLHGW